MEKIFIQSVTTGDYNRRSFSKRKGRSTKNSTCEHVYFTPNEGACPLKIKAELHRGNTFFSAKDGFLFGVYHELTKLGEFSKVYA